MLRKKERLQKAKFGMEKITTLIFIKGVRQ